MKVHEIFVKSKYRNKSISRKIIHYFSSGNLRPNVRELPIIPLKTDTISWVRVSYVDDPELIYVQPLDVVGFDGKEFQIINLNVEISQFC